ncbi:response regulator transcription factor [Aquincola sp. S2]|uniref:Response regulator transcription factor n=1 Tax=Pseudaquabacterium terrae TaxID=2732868 RepID=A0ABX2EIG5_9BURK|nr:response regulator transcription factor [Aquabacterium terrae]NRF68445.1 response regulator transcription factor [Aquabacterium terrae]
MNIACCIRNEFLAAELPELLVRHGLDYELFRHEIALMRALRHRGGIDLVIVDVGNDSAMEAGVLSWLRSRIGETVPVLLLSSRWDAQRVADALEAGADDCIARPFDHQELIARVKAVLRRSGASDAGRTRAEVAGFVLDKRAGTLMDRGVPVTLTPREFALAWLLFSNAGARLSREAISLAIWGADKDIAGRAIEQHVYKLRRKIGLSPERGVVIRTTYAQGYRLEQCEVRHAHGHRVSGIEMADSHRAVVMQA